MRQRHDGMHQIHSGPNAVNVPVLGDVTMVPFGSESDIQPRVENKRSKVM